MVEEIDLKVYIKILLRHWMWIVGLAVLTAVIAFAVSSLQPHIYKASAMVVVTKPRYVIQFDPRFRTDVQTPDYRAFTTLATSESTLQGVIDAYTPSPEAGINEWSVATLSGMVQANSTSDPSLVILTVGSRSPQDAAAITNHWADSLVQESNKIYGRSQEDVTYFEKQSAQAKDALEEVEAAVVEFEAGNQISIIKAELDSKNRIQADYLTEQRAITYLIQDIQRFREHLAKQPSNQPVSLADSLTTLSLQVKAFNAYAVAPVDFQVDSAAALVDKDVSEQIAFLDDLVTMLEERSSDIDTLLAELEPQILDFQRRYEELRVENDRWTRIRTLAVEAEMTLARKLDEARIAVQEDQSGVQVGSYAVVPGAPIGRRRLFNTAVGGALGLVAGMALAVIFELIRAYQRAAKDKGSGDGS